jgi:hypothetical protein
MTKKDYTTSFTVNQSRMRASTPSCRVRKSCVACHGRANQLPPFRVISKMMSESFHSALSLTARPNSTSPTSASFRPSSATASVQGTWVSTSTKRVSARRAAARAELAAVRRRLGDRRQDRISLLQGGTVAISARGHFACKGRAFVVSGKGLEAVP